MILRSHLISLTQVPGVGPRRIRNLIRTYPETTSLTDLSVKDLQQVDGISTEIAANIRRINLDFGKTALEKMQSLGGTFVSYWDEGYPPLLQSIYDAPVGLFVKGEFPNLPAIAVVGTRAVTAYGRKLAKSLTSELVSAGLAVISGLAAGVDTICHTTVMEQGGRTAAVLGNGLDICYPSQNRKIMERIGQTGALISEYPPGTKPDAPNFPKRNRIISGLSLGTLVIEAGDRSGALITAYSALDQNREVFALPGPVDSRYSIGCHKLIQRGAKLVMTAADVLEELPLTSPPQQAELMPDLTGNEKLVFDCLSHDPLQIDELCLMLQQDSPEVLSVLLGLELKNLVIQQPGKLFTRR